MFRADLHCHSTFSDGSLTPEELIKAAKKAGLQALSITDHDSVEAYPLPREVEGLMLLPGIEFSADCEGKDVHILAYSLSWDKPDLIHFCLEQQKRRRERLKKLLALLKKAGMPLEEAEIIEMQPTAPGRAHIARALVGKGYVPDMKTAFSKYLKEGKPCFVRRAAFPVQETLDLIRGAGAIAILAHPHLIKDKSLIQKLCLFPFQGVECYYGSFPIEICQPWLDLAKEKRWLISGGSDFHGDESAHARLGSSWIDREAFDKIISYLVK